MAAPTPPGRKLAERPATCKQCRGPAMEVLVATSISPQGVWLLICRKCGT